MTEWISRAAGYPRRLRWIEGNIGRTGIVMIVLAVLLQGCDGDDDTGPSFDFTLVSGTGDITQELTQFRTLLGDPNNGATAGQQPAGRREISWDGVPAAFTNTNTFPGSFFHVNNTRGLITRTPGTGFRVSDNDFNDVNPLYDAQFNDFSPIKTFAAVGSNVIDVTFRVAGSNQAAGVTGFGVVFSDVDRDGSTTVEYFNLDRILESFDVPARSDANGHSFLGVVFEDILVTRVRITHGEAPLGANENDITDGGTRDLAITDDFIYGEPQSVLADTLDIVRATDAPGRHPEARHLRPGTKHVPAPLIGDLAGLGKVPANPFDYAVGADASNVDILTGLQAEAAVAPYLEPGRAEKPEAGRPRELSFLDRSARGGSTTNAKRGEALTSVSEQGRESSFTHAPERASG
jgi:hypothetical protein